MGDISKPKETEPKNPLKLERSSSPFKGSASNHSPRELESHSSSTTNSDRRGTEKPTEKARETGSRPAKGTKRPRPWSPFDIYTDPSPRELESHSSSTTNSDRRGTEKPTEKSKETDSHLAKRRKLETQKRPPLGDITEKALNSDQVVANFRAIHKRKISEIRDNECETLGGLNEKRLGGDLTDTENQDPFREKMLAEERRISERAAKLYNQIPESLRNARVVEARILYRLNPHQEHLASELGRERGIPVVYARDLVLQGQLPQGIYQGYGNPGQTQGAPYGYPGPQAGAFSHQQQYTGYDNQQGQQWQQPADTFSRPQQLGWPATGYGGQNPGAPGYGGGASAYHVASQDTLFGSHLQPQPGRFDHHTSGTADTQTAAPRSEEVQQLAQFYSGSEFAKFYPSDSSRDIRQEQYIDPPEEDPIAQLYSGDEFAKFYLPGTSGDITEVQELDSLSEEERKHEISKDFEDIRVSIERMKDQILQIREGEIFYRNNVEIFHQWRNGQLRDVPEDVLKAKRAFKAINGYRKKLITWFRAYGAYQSVDRVIVDHIQSQSGNIGRLLSAHRKWLNKYKSCMRDQESITGKYVPHYIEELLDKVVSREQIERARPFLE